MKVDIKSSEHGKTAVPYKQQGWLQRFLNWLIRGAQKASDQQAACSG